MYGECVILWKKKSSYFIFYEDCESVRNMHLNAISNCSFIVISDSYIIENIRKMRNTGLNIVIINFVDGELSSCESKVKQIENDSEEDY